MPVILPSLVGLGKLFFSFSGTTELTLGNPSSMQPNLHGRLASEPSTNKDLVNGAKYAPEGKKRRLVVDSLMMDPSLEASVWLVNACPLSVSLSPDGSFIS